MVGLMYGSKPFSKSGTITLPHKWRQQFGLLPGRLAELFYQNKRLYIKKAVKDSTHNKRYISEKGTVHIPKELREEMGMNEQSSYCLHVMEKENCFMITRENER
ncbi:AbrB/MazE/SpoVT family DNA-binding domain-containing protein [Rossellomorea aquimaris]|uniref:AbrB/MazE/SpoVT family DNA-binding domain-containing protein n=1 Tax=Rossellomorea aquimaris TaxID=189382 RepID=UPI001CD49481|nr:AbrB/MazE/SpoVT family DNA-binding domain-containing protein [Rossellomorea aquimaris]MCA1059929.1 AbrB/MazE/SpoVT family DNA-binding domain-containing protein [Rossellomorea aquimaris]